MRTLMIGLIVLAACACSPHGKQAVARSNPAERVITSTGSRSTTAGGAASCVEAYSTKTLTHRKFAFDGTVTSVTPGERNADAGATPVEITYTVHEWFAGGSGETVTLKSWDFTAAGSDEDPVAQGARLLVSGDTDMPWGCGFTRDHTESEAEQWRRAFDA